MFKKYRSFTTKFKLSVIEAAEKTNNVRAATDFGVTDTMMIYLATSTMMFMKASMDFSLLCFFLVWLSVFYYYPHGVKTL